jgi:signal transduction histidine kinase
MRKITSIKQYVIWIIVVLTVILLGTAIFGALLMNSQNKLTESYKNRYDSYVIADELRQSSDDLTKFIKMYATTEDDYYKTLYLEVLKIRNGDVERPINYERIYWDFLIPSKTYNKKSSSGIALMERMKSSGFTDDELEQLQIAERESNQLVKLELLAMRALEDALIDDDEQLRLEGESNQDFAIRILNDDFYNISKSKIMSPINDFYSLFDERTLKNIDNATKVQQQLSMISIGILTVFFGMLLALFVKVFKLVKQNEAILESKILERTSELVEKNHVLTNAKEKLVESEKLASLGGLVAGIAHEINTPIGVSVTVASHIVDETQVNIALLEEKKLSKSDLINYFNSMTESSKLLLGNMEKAKVLVSSFKQVAVDQSNDEMREVNLEQYIYEILASFNSKFKNSNYAISVECEKKIELYTYPGVIYQILANLLMNTLNHGFLDLDHGDINIYLQEIDDTVVIEYRDNGKGISEAHLHKVFDPFFTTRRGQGGSGLGLNIVYNLVSQKLKGSIECTSELGKGAVFRITIPKDISTVKGVHNESRI